MTTSLNMLLAEIKRATGCESIGGNVLPLPPSSLPDTSGLLLNCYFGSELLDVDPLALLARCRGYANQALVTIEGFVRNHDIDFDTIGVSIFHSSGKLANVRVYWANSRKDLLSEFGSRVTHEGSHLDEVSCLLST